jgi:putative DNA primase/helicase
MRQDAFTYTPTFKLVIAGNHKPLLRNVDDAMRRRFRMVPFTTTPKEIDQELEDKLRAEWPAILRWMIAGCMDWQDNGLVMPAKVAAATDEYFADQDLFTQFIDERCDVDLAVAHTRPGGIWGKAADLFASWKAYAEAAGERPGSAKRLGDQLSRRGLVRGRHLGVRVWLGVALKVTDDR